MNFHLLQNKQSLFWVKSIFIYSRTNKVCPKLNEFSSTPEQTKFFCSRLNESSSTPEQTKFVLG